MDLQLNFSLTLFSPRPAHPFMLFPVVYFLPQFYPFNSFQLKNTSAHERLSSLLSCSDSEGSHLPQSILSTPHLQSSLPFELLKESMLKKEKCY